MKPLNDAVKAYAEKGFSRLHMPGHKGAAAFPEHYKFDITEVGGADSLYEAAGAIAETEAAFSEIYGSGATLLSAGGSTLCIQTMLATALTEGDTLIIARNCHSSAVNSAALLGLNLVWVNPNRLFELEQAFADYPEAKAVYVTSPDYFGVMADIAACSKICREHGALLLVDNAHGAHLKFFPTKLHPLDLGADFCAESLHKTLPVLTGGALLHLKDGALYKKAKRKMRLFGSTSPSYLIMLSADFCLDYLKNDARTDFANLLGKVANLRYKAFERGLAPKTRSVEPARLTLSVTASGLSAEEFGARLREHKIEPEYVNSEWAVLMFSPFNSAEDFARAEEFIGSIEGNGFAAPPEILKKIPERALGVREAVFSESELLPIGEAAGKIASELCLPCPPCIALACPGEIIDESIIALFKKYGIGQISVVK